MTKLTSLADLIKANRSLLTLSLFCAVGACAGEDQPAASSDQGKLASYYDNDQDEQDDAGEDETSADEGAAPSGGDSYTVESELSPGELDDALIALTDEANAPDVISDDVAFTTAQCTVLAGLANGAFHDQAMTLASEYLNGTRFDLPAGRSLELKNVRSFSVTESCGARIDINTVVHRPNLKDPKGHLAISGVFYPTMRGDKKSVCFGDMRMGNSDLNIVVENLAERVGAKMIKKMDDYCFDIPEMFLQWEAAVGPIDWASGQ